MKHRAPAALDVRQSSPRGQYYSRWPTCKWILELFFFLKKVCASRGKGTVFLWLLCFRVFINYHSNVFCHVIFSPIIWTFSGILGVMRYMWNMLLRNHLERLGCKTDHFPWSIAKLTASSSVWILHFMGFIYFLNRKRKRNHRGKINIIETLYRNPLT